MKKVIWCTLAGILFVSAQGAEGSIAVTKISDVSEDKPFELYMRSISDIESGVTTFTFDIQDIKNTQAIGYWKVRVWCENDITVTLDSDTHNLCGDASDMEFEAGKDFALTLYNATGGQVGFSFKLKAYDKNDMWIHSEKKSFRWN